ncbi:MAG: sugar ABC transporter permease, partial [Acidimicrobiia bacterium]
MAVATETQPKGQPKAGDLVRGERRLAYWLLLPTLIILVAIAFYPLGQVFYKSFTNDTFASAVETDFVGFQNYSDLLSISFAELPPEIDEATGEQVIDPETGEPEYMSPVQVLP